MNRLDKPRIDMQISVFLFFLVLGTLLLSPSFPRAFVFSKHVDRFTDLGVVIPGGWDDVRFPPTPCRLGPCYANSSIQS